jgi:predicted acetyltransferase
MQLIKPCLQYAKTWKAGLTEFQQEKLAGFWNYFGQPNNIEKYIQLCHQNSQEINLPPNGNPSLTFWLIDNQKFIGHCNIRHKLPSNTYPGHIGYHIIKSERGKGYGTKILKLAIAECHKLGLKKLTLYTDSNNLSSQKVIIKNGGQQQRQNTQDGKELVEWVIN